MMHAIYSKRLVATKIRVMSRSSPPVRNADRLLATGFLWKASPCRKTMVFASRTGRCFVMLRAVLSYGRQWHRKYLPREVSEYVCDQLGIIYDSYGHEQKRRICKKRIKAMENKIREAIRLLRQANLTDEQKREFSRLATELDLTVRDVTECQEETTDDKAVKPHYIN